MLDQYDSIIMEYRKIINLLDNAPNRSTKFKTKDWVEINDDTRGMYNTNSQFKFKTSMLKSGLCDYSDTYILVSWTISVEVTSAAGATANNTNKNVTFKDCAQFTDCISGINNTEVDNIKDIDLVMPMHNLIECSESYLKASGSLWHCYRDEPSLDNNSNIADFTGANHNNKSIKYKPKIAGQADDDSNKIVPLKYLSNFWRTNEILLTSCEINCTLTRPGKCVVVSNTAVNQATTSAITDAKLYVPVVTLSTQDSAKLLQQLKSGF